ncbi:MAG: rod shape-determining protein RodA [Firmicutes bacterium]|nr:rod shape-determining protein RodA [Bacillota bacterium]MDY5855641.1 rod shape-determining protein RodA [Anaerovoracaceae bacterium]
MNKIYNTLKSADKVTLLLILVLGFVSLLMLESTIYDDGFVFSWKDGRAVIIQAIAYLLGFCCIVVVLAVNYNFFYGLEKLLYALSLLFLLTVYIPGLGIEQYGARSWIDLKVTTLQPSEFVKITFVLIMAGYLSQHRDELRNFRGVFKAVLYAAPMIAIVLKEDLGSALVYIVIWIFMVFFAGIDYKVFFQCAGLTAAMIPIAYRFLSNYQKERIEAFLHPDNLSLPGNYQVWQSKVAIGSGGFRGTGLFQGTQKSLDFIPVQQSDFIFSVVGEELGFLGGFGLILLYGLLTWRFTRILRDSEDLYGALIVVGFIGMFLFQIFENIAMTMGLMPVTGITLPFLSGGGTSVIASMISVGLILNVGVNSKTIKF